MKRAVSNECTGGVGVKRRSRVLVADFLFLAALLVFAALWAWNQFITSPPYIDPDKYPVRGIDISSHNGTVNLEAAAAEGISFVFIKASEGESFIDPGFDFNYKKAVEAGLQTGAYHFFRFDVDGISQGINLLKAVKGKELDLGLVIDVEEAGNPRGIHPDTIQERLASMTDFLTLKGHRVMFYTNREGYYNYIQQNFSGYPLWICSFYSTPINTAWTFWQYDHHGRVKGIKGDVDLNVFCGSRREWYDFLIGEYHPETGEAQ